jgi:hypothetical protein
MSDPAHDLALLHHAFYVGELEVGRRAAERLLRQDLPEDSATRARHNRTFYTPTLAELGPVEFRRIDIKPAYHGWSLFNPTLLNNNGKLVGLVRSSNYTMKGMQYIMPPADKGVIRTISIFVEYAPDFSVAASHALADPDYPRTTFAVDGLEDCRLYARGDALYVSATVRNFAPYDGNCRIGTARLDTAGKRYCELEVPAAPGSQHEKNWMPVIGQDCWLYACNQNDKTFLARRKGVNWELVSTGPAPIVARSFRGGAQLVPFGGGYLCAIHEVTHGDNRRTYEHRFVWFDDQLRVKKLSAPFYFRNKRQIEFAAGLAVIGDQVVLSFGYQDKEAWLAILSAQAVSERLSPV